MAAEEANGGRPEDAAPGPSLEKRERPDAGPGPGPDATLMMRPAGTGQPGEAPAEPSGDAPRDAPPEDRIPEGYAAGTGAPGAAGAGAGAEGSGAAASGSGPADAGGAGHGWGGAGAVPPPPTAPPSFGGASGASGGYGEQGGGGYGGYGGQGGGGGAPGDGGAAGRGEARPAQAVLTGLLNLSCLGLGYVLLRHWLGAAVCWAATAALLVVALPADVDGVPAGVLIGYGVFLLAAAADGARRGLRARLRVGEGARRLALPLAVVLLAVPAGGSFAYGAARDEAVERSLLDRLAAADALVAAHQGQAFEPSLADYRSALATYQDLGTKRAGSRAGKLVPDRLDAYYRTVSAPYARKSYCEALAPLRHLRTLPGTVDKALLAGRPGSVEEPLAQSLYECGAAGLGRSGGAPDVYFKELSSTFPGSAYTAKIEPAVAAAVRTRVDTLGTGGRDHCATTEELRALRKTAAPDALALDAVRGEADRGVQRGVFACGTHQFGNEQFTKAAETMDGYVKDYPGSAQADHARAISIAAQIAALDPAAGRKLPPATEPDGARMVMVVSNDAPDAVDLLYTGPVTGRITLKACAGCSYYQRSETLRPGFKPCSGASSKYPKATIELPPGQYHLLQKRAGTGFTTSGDTKSSKATIQSGYDYTNCLYVTSSSLLDPLIPLKPRTGGNS
ncbi:hypothetical protein [Streptomyces termitum]|uniref:hypothetical protein n=1 Tax=Streptomyces termitum TaxID=67368 RepID=UPI0033B17642